MFEGQADSLEFMLVTEGNEFSMLTTWRILGWPTVA